MDKHITKRLREDRKCKERMARAIEEMDNRFKSHRTASDSQRFDIALSKQTEEQLRRFKDS